MAPRATAVLAVILLVCVPEGAKAAARRPDAPCVKKGEAGCGGATCGHCKAEGAACHRCSVNDGGACSGGTTANHYCRPRCAGKEEYLSWEKNKCLDRIKCGKGERFVPQS